MTLLPEIHHGARDSLAAWSPWTTPVELLKHDWRLAPSNGLLPHPGQLVALGTVLCLFRPSLGGELEGWRRARRVAAVQHVDSEGPNECLCFFDAEEECCWRLYLLPDSDFLAWDRVLEGVPAMADTAGGGVGERLWRRLAGRLRGDIWRGSVIRLHLTGGMGMQLAASAATPSEWGRKAARRIGRVELD
jgi:hypothetical protein